MPLRAVALLAVAAVAVGGCATTTATPSPAPTPIPTLPAAEGSLNLLVWPGYAEDGSTDPAFDWVTPFELETGCEVRTTEAANSAELLEAFETGEYDGLSASGDVTARLVDDGAVAPVNLSLIPNHERMFEGLKELPTSTFDGVAYGVPHGRGANLLLYVTDAFPQPPESWSAVFDPGSPAAGSISVYDSAIYLADAAVYLMATRPELNITDPFALDEAQFAAVLELLRGQKGMIAEYWRSPAQQIQSFGTGRTLAGASWQYQTSRLMANDLPVQATLPREGATGWSVSWMIAAGAPHPGCMYRWMDWILSPQANAMATVWVGEAPVSPQACREAERLSPEHCRTYRAADEEFFSQIWYWRRPEADCGDERGAVCKDYADWSRAWEEIRNMPPPASPGASG